MLGCWPGADLAFSSRSKIALDQSINTTEILCERTLEDFACLKIVWVRPCVMGGLLTERHYLDLEIHDEFRVGAWAFLPKYLKNGICAGLQWMPGTKICPDNSRSKDHLVVGTQKRRRAHSVRRVNGGRGRRDSRAWPRVHRS